MNKRKDSKLFQFDFLVENDLPNDVERELVLSGSKIYRIPKLSKRNICKYIKSIYKVIRENHYNIIHMHSIQTRPIVPIIAKVLGVRLRILHSHSADFNKKNKVIIKLICQKIAVFCSNKYIACSEKAALFLFGKKKIKKVKILYNGIDIEKFRFNYEDRIEIRKSMNIDEKEKVLVHIGRMTFLKNQKFLIDIMERVKDNPIKLKLVLIGDGEDRDYLEGCVNEKGLEKNIIFLGAKRDVEKYLSASDLFIFPSISEGLGISAIEAQANGLNSIFSSGIPKEVIRNKNIKVISLHENIDIWLKEIYNFVNKENDRMEIDDLINDFSINYTVEEYQKFIINCYEEESIL